MRARAERKPLHLSIGRYLSTRTPNEVRFYSRDVVGETLNDSFINVKIDADERPDLERFFTINFEPNARRANTPMFELYPTTVFLETSQLTMSLPANFFSLDPYDESRTRLLYSSNEVLNWHLVHASFKEGSGSILLSEAHRRGRIGMNERAAPAYDALMDEATALRERVIEVDAQNGVSTQGYLQGLVSQLLRLWFLSDHRTREDTKGLDIALIALTRWVRDVVFDHVEGGFFNPSRYQGEMGAEMSKSLEFNAWTLELLMRAVVISRDSLLTETAGQTADFIVERLQMPDGGFAAGLHDPTNSTRFAWDRRTVRRTLTEDEYLVIETLYGLDKKANWNGRWLLRRTGSWRSVVDQLFFSKSEAEALLASGREKLRDLALARVIDYQIDDRRLMPGNATAISALMFAGTTLDKPRWCDAAARGLRWILANRVGENGLENVDGSTRGVTLVDCAMLLRAMLDVLAHQWDSDIAKALSQFIESIKSRFWDEKLLTFCEVDVAGLLMTFPHSHQLGKTHPVDAVRRGLQLYATLYQDSDVFVMLKRMFDDIESVGAAFDLQVNPSSDFTLDFRQGEVVVVLRGPDVECRAWREELNKTYKPFRHVFSVPFSEARDLPPCVPRMMSVEDRQRVIAYLLHDAQQYDVIDDLDELKHELVSL